MSKNQKSSLEKLIHDMENPDIDLAEKNHEFFKKVQEMEKRNQELDIYTVEEFPQKVELYYDVLTAKKDMNNHISDGWAVHSFSISSNDDVLVVYEKAK